MGFRFILNIGLDKVDASALVAAEVARQMLAANDILIVRDAVLQSDTEPTLVAEVDTLSNSAMLVLQQFHQVAVDLNQDCIAVYRPQQKSGALIGPRSQAWGSFNPEFFFNLDGSRLASPLANAA